MDDPAKLDRLTLANLQEHRQARNSLSALHAARSCLFGDRQLGNRKWYSDRPGIASRLKTQTHRRQFRLGLVANLAFYNLLNQNDVHRLLHTGVDITVASFSEATKITLAHIAHSLQQAAPISLLRIFCPKKAQEIELALQRVSALAAYNQSLCGHLAASEALEPAHAAVTEVLRTGADFDRAYTFQPVHVAAQAIAHLCAKPDVDGVIPPKKKPKVKLEPTKKKRNPAGGRYRPGVCFAFQRGACALEPCRYQHVCGHCFAADHSGQACPTYNA